MLCTVSFLPLQLQGTSPSPWSLSHQADKNPVPSYVWEAITRRDSLCPCKTNKQVLEARNWLSQSHRSNLWRTLTNNTKTIFVLCPLCVLGGCAVFQTYPGNESPHTYQDIIKLYIIKFLVWVYKVHSSFLAPATGEFCLWMFVACSNASAHALSSKFWTSMARKGWLAGDNSLSWQRHTAPGRNVTYWRSKLPSGKLT